VVDSCTVGTKVATTPLQATPLFQSNFPDQITKAVPETSFYSPAFQLPAVNPFSTPFSSGIIHTIIHML
jgi:hypothetical protein